VSGGAVGRRLAAEKVVPIRPAAAATPYALAPEFLRAVCFRFAGGHADKRDGLWAQFGPAIEPELIADPCARVVVETVRAVYAETKRAPTVLATTMQRMQRSVDDGALSYDAFEDACAYLLEFDPTTAPGPEELAAQLEPVLSRAVIQRRLAPEAVNAMVTMNTKRLQKSIALVEKMQAQTQAIQPGGDWDEADAEAERFAELPTFRTGLPIDAMIGGIKRIAMTQILAGTGVGKSPALIHMIAEAMFEGLFVVGFTLEDPDPMVRARLKANLLNCRVDEAIADPRGCTRKMLDAFPGLGRFRLHELPADTTTPEDLFDIVDAEEQQAGRSIDVLAIDYPGKLAAPRKAVVGADGKTYTKGKAVYTRLITYTKGADRVEGGHPGGAIWTFSVEQIGRAAKQQTSAMTVENVRKKPIGTDDAADSMEASRSPWVVFTLNPTVDDRDELSGIVLHVAKNKAGRRFDSVELTPDLGRCRIHSPLPHRDPRPTEGDRW
jgi:hypothetical protein